jgi:hypothetical protein
MAACLRGWQAAIDAHTIPGAGIAHVERVLRLWLDTALGHVAVRRQITALLVEVATGPRSSDSSRAASAMPVPAVTDFMIGAVERWSALGPADAARLDVEEAIVIAATRSWWPRLLKIIRLKLRRKIL